MVPTSDWGPAKEVAREFFTEIGFYDGEVAYEDRPALWDGKAVHASSAANLLHEVAHFQLAPRWRRFVHGYGLGFEPEGGGNRDAPLLVSTGRAFKEEALASALGIWWEIHLGYEKWQETASEHSWVRLVRNEEMNGIKYPAPPRHQKDFIRITGPVTKKLIKLGVLGPDYIPRAILAPPWRHSSFKHAD